MQRNQGGLLAGLLLVAVGGLLLAGDVGLVSTDALLRLLDLWPVALIVIGLEVIVRRLLPRPQAAIAGVAIVALALAGGLAYAILSPRQQNQMTTATGPVAGAQKGALDLGLGAASIDARTDSLGSDLFRADLDFPRGQAPDVTAEAGTVTIRDHPLNGFRLPFGGRRHIGLTLNRDLPWSVSVGGGATSGSFSLQSANLTGLEVSGGANSENVSLPPPHGTVTISVSGGSSSVKLHRPAGVAIAVHLSGGASRLTADGHGASALGGDLDWKSAGYDAAADRYEVDVSGGASSIQVDQSQ